MLTVDVKTVVSAASLALVIGGGVLTIKLDIQQLKSDVATLRSEVREIGCDVRPSIECNFKAASINGR